MIGEAGIRLMNLSEYKQKSAHIIELENRYAVEECLLGKHFAMRVSDNCALEVVIPSIFKKDGVDVIGIPGMLMKYGGDIDGWGKIDCYETINEVETVKACVSAVLVICYTKNGEVGLKSGVIQNMARKVLHTLHIINPQVIRTNSDTVPNDLCEIDVSFSIMDDGKPQTELIIPAMLIDDRGSRLSFTDIKQSIRNSDKTVSASYEMLDNARVNLSHYDTRAAVLNCATAIEVTLKKMLIGYLESNSVPESLNKYVLKQADGYSKQVELLKKLSIPLKGLSGVKEQVMDVRNRVIHGGYTPSLMEAHKSYSCTCAALKDLEVRMFEE